MKGSIIKNNNKKSEDKMKPEITYTSSEILSMTGLKPYQLDYIVRVGEIPVIKSGKANPRLFPVDALDEILNILHKRGQFPKENVYR